MILNFYADSVLYYNLLMEKLLRYYLHNTTTVLSVNRKKEIVTGLSLINTVFKLNCALGNVKMFLNLLNRKALNLLL